MSQSLTQAENKQPNFSDPEHIVSREQVIALLAEASEIEHDLMCCYLYAAFSLKTDEDDGLSEEQAKALRRWRAEIIGIAVEEMGHLALVANILCAIGAAPHFGRMNFPIDHGYFPANMSIRLTPFDMATLEHFIFLERPEDSEFQDSDKFESDQHYERGALEQIRLTPMAHDYKTVGELYQTIIRHLKTLNDKYQSENLFVGCRNSQIGPDITPLPGLITVENLEEAITAIETIVAQGEGAPEDCGKGHFARFCQIKEEYDAFLEQDADFTPGRPVAENPVLRKPPMPEGRVWINAPEAASVADFTNTLYNHMLRLLAQAFGRYCSKREKQVLITAATELMYAMTPAAVALTKLKANDEDGVNAGVSFATLRSSSPFPTHSDWKVLLCRFKEIQDVGHELSCQGKDINQAVALLDVTVANFEREVKRIMADQSAKSDSKDVDNSDALSQPAHLPSAENLEQVEGKDVILSFDGKKCIHARFCVTGAPKTFLANVEGPWLHPDDTHADILANIAERCPSGAITIVRKDGRPNEQAPEVNTIKIRENGPLAVHADISLNDENAGFRLTLCRCGKSANKPYCDGAHADAGFCASGEPDSRNTDMMEVRDGELSIRTLKNGPLQVSGSVEVLSGTGRNVERTQSVRLCRCGASATKPFCDNSHVKVGFEAE